MKPDILGNENRYIGKLNQIYGEMKPDIWGNENQKYGDIYDNGKYNIKDFVEAPNEKILKYNKGMKFDCIVSNAPYDNGLHEKFESKYFELCKGEIVWVSPLSFLLGKKQNKRITL